MSGSLAHEVRRSPLTGSAFVRVLAALADAPAPASPDAFAQRLSGWFDWTHAFSLSAALGDASERSAVPAFGGQGALQADEREFARVRSALAKAIADATACAAEPRRGVRATAAVMPVDFASWRQRYARCQLAMETQIVPLRRRLRSSLADRSARLAKLAELDIVMEQVVGAQERALLAGVAGRLEPRFDALRQASSEAGPWLDRFRQEMRGLLLAELELRLQPVEGLLQACRKSFTESLIPRP